MSEFRRLYETRREFFERSLLTAVAAGTTGSMLGAATAQAAQGTGSPNERRRVAVIGVNGRGQSHINGMGGLKDCEIAIICDCDENVGQRKLESTKKKEGQASKDARFVKDLREVMDDDSIDIVTVATPNHWHSLASIWAMQAGKDVYCEKPVSHNVSEGRRMVQVARKEGRICQTGTQCRSQAGSIAGIDYIRSGKIGAVDFATGLCYKRRKSIGPKGNYDVPSGVDYDLWCGPAPDGPLTRKRFHYDWHWQFDYGNGDLGNQGIHQMDVARWGLGVNGVGTHVMSYGGRLDYVDAGDVANTQVSIHEYPDNKRITFEVRGLETDAFRGSKIGVIFYGEDGLVVMTSYTRGAAFDWDGNRLQDFNGGGNHFQNFLDAVKSRNHEELNADIEEGHLSSALCHLGNISYRLGEQIAPGELVDRLKATKEVCEDDFETDDTVDAAERMLKHTEKNDVDFSETPLFVGPLLKLDGETFVGSGETVDKANKMLTREYREGYVVPSESEI